MAEIDRIRWNQRYSSGWQSSLHKTILDFYKLAKTGRALELACGTGENAVFLAKQGFSVDAIDISDVAIEKAKSLAKKEDVNVNFINADLDCYQLPMQAYDLVIVFYYLNRNKFKEIEKALKPGGILIYETYNERYTVIRQDFNRDYLLGLGELEKAFSDLDILCFKEPNHISTLVAKKIEVNLLVS